MKISSIGFHYALLPGLLIGLLVGFIPHSVANASNIVSDTSVTDRICFHGLIPKFHQDSVTGKISYQSFNATKYGKNDACKKSDTPLKFLYGTHSLFGKPYSAKESNATRRGQVFSQSGKPFKVVSEEKILNGNSVKSNKLKIFSENPADEIFSGVNERATNRIESVGNQNVLEASSLSVEVTSVPSTRKFARLLGREANLSIIPSKKEETEDNTDYLPPNYRAHISATPKISTNQCWMIVPQSELEIIPPPMGESIKGTFDISESGVPEQGIPELKLHRHQDFAIYYLGDDPDPNDATKVSDVICEQTSIKNDFFADYYRAQGKVPPPPHDKFSFKFSEFHPVSIDDPHTVTTEEARSEKIENNHLFGIDHALVSRSPNTLDIVLQTGFKSSDTLKSETPTNKDEKAKMAKKAEEVLESERKLKGSLVYYQIERDADALKDNKSFSFQSININKKCDISGWSYQPNFSQKGDYLYFLNIPRDDNDLVFDRDVAQLIRLKIHPDSKTIIGDCSSEKQKDLQYITSSDDLKNRFDLTEYHIQDYRLSSENNLLSLTREKHGESVVEFFRLDADSGKITHKQPEQIQGIGRIYDYVKDTQSSGNYYYVFHSNFTHPIRISRCKVSRRATSCSSTDSTNHQGYKDGEPERALVNVIPDDYIFNKNIEISSFSVGKQKNACDETTSEEPLGTDNNSDDDKDNYNIHVFKLKPKGNSKGAIISVHGGPNDAWNGVFSEREYRLAQLGYTIYLPNPLGSTGYGKAFAKASQLNWGEAIFEDIEKVSKCVHTLEPDLPMYLMGFSFGGYMANLMQFKPDKDGTFNTRDLFDGFIAINPVFDLKQFAHSTDQLWFPEYQLGESGIGCFGSDVDCDPDLEDRASKEKPTTLDKHNPAYFAAKYKPNSDSTRSPTLFFLGTFDQRIHFCSNAPGMLKTFREKELSYTLQIEKGGMHQFDTQTNFDQAHKIHRWLEETQNCDPADPTSCKINDDGEPFLDHRGNYYLYDNSIPLERYKNYQVCFAGIEGKK